MAPKAIQRFKTDKKVRGSLVLPNGVLNSNTTVTDIVTVLSQVSMKSDTRYKSRANCGGVSNSSLDT